MNMRHLPTKAGTRVVYAILVITWCFGVATGLSIVEQRLQPLPQPIRGAAY